MLLRPGYRDLDMVEHAGNGRMRLAHRDGGAGDAREFRAQRLRHVERQRLDQEAALAGDDLLDLDEGGAVIDGRLHGVVLQAGAGIDLQFGIDIEALPEPLLLLEQAVAGEERAVRHADRVSHRPFLRAVSPRPIMASALASAPAFVAPSSTRPTAAPCSRSTRLVAAVPASRASGASRPVTAPMKRLREVPTASGRPSAWSSPSRAIRSRLSCAVSLAKPKPGSSTILSGSTPASWAMASEVDRNTSWSSIGPASFSRSRPVCMM